MVKKMVLLFGIISAQNCLATPASYFDCNEVNQNEYELNFISNEKAASVYAFGGAGTACLEIALELNIQRLKYGVGTWYDCEYPDSGFTTLKSSLGVVLTTRWTNFVCEKVALSLNRYH